MKVAHAESDSFLRPHREWRDSGGQEGRTGFLSQAQACEERWPVLGLSRAHRGSVFQVSPLESGGIGISKDSFVFSVGEGNPLLLGELGRIDPMV